MAKIKFLFSILFAASIIFFNTSAANAGCECTCYSDPTMTKVSIGPTYAGNADLCATSICAGQASNRCVDITAAEKSGIIPDGGKLKYGSYGLNDFVQVAINISTVVLGLTGSLALLAFVYGGFTFMLSSGSSEQVNKGKQILIGAVIGLVIVFTSYMIIGFILQTSGFIAPNTTAWANTSFISSWMNGK
jgi:hypothetical protein